jgi:hypothetical protein
MPKKIPAFLLFATLGTAIGLSAIAVNPASAEEAFSCAKIKKAKLKQICTDKNMTKNDMKKQMKEWNEKANDNGWDGKCGKCHEDGTKGGPLKPSADGEWPKFAKAAGIE